MDASRVIQTEDHATGVALIEVDENSGQNAIMVIPSACDHMPTRKWPPSKTSSRARTYSSPSWRRTCPPSRPSSIWRTRRQDHHPQHRPGAARGARTARQGEHRHPQRGRGQHTHRRQGRRCPERAEGGGLVLRPRRAERRHHHGRHGRLRLRRQALGADAGLQGQRRGYHRRGRRLQRRLRHGAFRGQRHLRAARFAAATAALSVQKMGTTPSMPTRAEIDEFLKQH